MANEFGVKPPEGPQTANEQEVTQALSSLGWTTDQIKHELDKLGPSGGLVSAHPDLLYALQEVRTAQMSASTETYSTVPPEYDVQESRPGTFRRVSGGVAKAVASAALVGVVSSGVHGLATGGSRSPFDRFFTGVIDGIVSVSSIFDRSSRQTPPGSVGSAAAKTATTTTPYSSSSKPAATKSASPTTNPDLSPVATPTADPSCETRLASAPTESLIALTIMAPIDGGGGGYDKKTTAADVRRIVGQYGLGGLIVMTAPTPETTAFLQQPNKGVPLMVGIDQEGGSVRRIKTGAGANLPSAAEMATKSDAEVTALIRAAAKQLRAAGIRADYAPVLDLAPSDGRDYAAGKTRVFSGDAAIVARLGKLYAEAMLAEGVIPVYKHFGLGSANNNTDLAPATVPGLDVLKNRDLRPYEVVPKSPQIGLMIGTFTTADGATGGKPANQSPLFYDLAKQYGFNGYITTDDIGTKAAGGKLARDFVDALYAGATMPLYVQDQEGGTLETQIKNILAEGTKRVASGAITKEQLVQKIAANAAALNTNICSIADARAK